MTVPLFVRLVAFAFALISGWLGYSTYVVKVNFSLQGSVALMGMVGICLCIAFWTKESAGLAFRLLITSAMIFLFGSCWLATKMEGAYFSFPGLLMVITLGTAVYALIQPKGAYGH